MLFSAPNFFIVIPVEQNDNVWCLFGKDFYPPSKKAGGDSTWLIDTFWPLGAVRRRNQALKSRTCHHALTRANFLPVVIGEGRNARGDSMSGNITMIDPVLPSVFEIIEPN